MWCSDGRISHFCLHPYHFFFVGRINPFFGFLPEFILYLPLSCYRGREHGARPAYGKVTTSSGLWWTSVVAADGVVREVTYPEAWSKRVKQHSLRVNTYSALHGSTRRIHSDTEVQNRAQYTVHSKGAKRKLNSKKPKITSSVLQVFHAFI